MRPFVLLSAALLVIGTGCAAGVNFERQSAHVIQPTPSPDSVRISEVHAGFGGSTWVATTPNGVYDCSQESGERTPICAKRHP